MVASPPLVLAKPPPIAPLTSVAIAGFGTFTGMCFLTAVDTFLGQQIGSEIVILIAPMAASAALIFGAPAAPFSQPRNVIGGHFVSATVGASTYKLICAYPVIKPAGGAIAASASVVAMMLTGCLHPPSAATSLIGVLGPDWVKECGLMYGANCAVGATVMVASGLIINNLFKKSYPTYW